MNNEIYIPSFSYSNFWNIENKTEAARFFIDDILIKTHSIFKYNNLPTSINERLLSLILQSNGHVCIARAEKALSYLNVSNNDIVFFAGAFSNKPDIYYQPTKYIIANPALSGSLNLEIGTDCVILSNDNMRRGIVNSILPYAQLFAETLITYKRALINARVSFALSAPDSATAETCKAFLTNCENGKISVLSDNAFSDTNIHSIALTDSNTSNISQIIESWQYLKSSALNAIGLDSNYNMKRESINADEAQLNDDALYPFIDNMFEQQKLDIEDINRMFDTNISIEFNSVWKRKKLEEEKSKNDEETVTEETVTEDKKREKKDE